MKILRLKPFVETGEKTFIIDDYFEQLQNVFDYFGVTGEITQAIVDRRNYYWTLNHGEDVIFGDKYDIINETDNIYQEEVISSEVYRGEHFTMVMINEDIYEGKILAIYDNSKELQINGGNKNEFNNKGNRAM